MKLSYRYLLVTTAFLFTGFLTSDSDIYFKINKSIELFGRVYRETAINYVDNINPETFMEEGIKGMLSSLDPYTVYLDQTHQNDIDLITKGKYGGIGATVGLRNDFVIIVDLLEGYSAQRQGMRIGDVIYEIDGIKITKENYAKLGTLMKGEPGSTLTMIIQREGAKSNLIFNLVREEIEVKNVSFSGFIPESSNNAYIKLSGFSRAAGEEVKDALIQMGKTKPVESIVLDLRGNPGGLLDAAIDVCEKFLKKNQLVVSVVGRDSNAVRRYYSEEEPVAKDTRLALLIDGYSASAAEIVAGAIQDHDRGIIVGDKSFGKGLVQTIIPMPYNSSLKITTAKYYTPSGRCIQEVDYSENSDILEVGSEDKNKEFYTDQERVVYSNGGIIPDSTVSGESESELVNQLVAYGMFFKYATNLLSDEENHALNLQSKDDLFVGFRKYLEDQKFEFNFEIDKIFERLETTIATRKYNSNIPEKVAELKLQFESEKVKELDLYRNEITKEINLELINRKEGRIGRIRSSLEGDIQFETALKILSMKEKYNRVLNKLD
ncbi:MAG: S41 family peptidase [Bacteroidetes bacterium]|nr:S41 family peptidase [Bacteroidota bacterium]